MKIKEIRDLTTEELQLKVTELKKELFTQRFALQSRRISQRFSQLSAREKSKAKSKA